MVTTINPSDQTITQYTVQVGGASNLLANIGPGSSGQVLQSGGNAANPAYSTATYPAIATGTGTILRADGTNWTPTTSTYPNTNAINTLLYASSANVMSALATATNGVLITDGTTGIPSISSTLPSAVQGNITTVGTIGTGAWQGTPVALAYGGTNANLTASNGGIFYSSGTAGAILSGTSTAGQLLTSGASTTPAWTTSTYPATNAASTLLYASSANTMAALATANTGALVTNSSGVPSWLTTGTTYSPTCLGGSTPGTSSYTIQAGRYCVIGPLCFVHFVLNGTFGAAAAGQLQVSLPFTSVTQSNLNMWGAAGLCDVNNVLSSPVNVANSNNQNFCTFFIQSSAGNVSVSASHSFLVEGSIAYFIA